MHGVWKEAEESVQKIKIWEVIAVLKCWATQSPMGKEQVFLRTMLVIASAMISHLLVLNAINQICISIFLLCTLLQMSLMTNCWLAKVIAFADNTEPFFSCAWSVINWPYTMCILPPFLSTDFHVDSSCRIQSRSLYWNNTCLKSGTGIPGNVNTSCRIASSQSEAQKESTFSLCLEQIIWGNGTDNFNVMSFRKKWIPSDSRENLLLCACSAHRKK